MKLEDALTIAALMEKNDTISTSAMACRRLAAEVKRLENLVIELRLSKDQQNV